MNAWECAHGGCEAKAHGTGGAVGLRAVGWWFQPGGPLLCPQHRPDGTTDHVPGMCNVPEGLPCSLCAGEREACLLQRVVCAALGVEFYDWIAGIGGALERLNTWKREQFHQVE